MANIKIYLRSLRLTGTTVPIVLEIRGGCGASHFLQNAEDDRVLGVVVKTYPIAMLTMQLRRYLDTRTHNLHILPRQPVFHAYGE